MSEKQKSAKSEKALDGFKKIQKKGMDELREILNSNKGKSMHPFKHIKLRPGTFIGSIVTSNEDDIQTVLPAEIGEDGTKKGKDTIKSLKIFYNQGLERIIMEPISNSKDNYWNSLGNHEMTYLSITADRVTGWITVENDGMPIPVDVGEYEKEDLETGKKTKETKYPAEKFFGEVNAGTNFDKDKVKKKSSGMNGLGGKLTNIFSKEFVIEIADHFNKKTFKMVFSNNGLNRTKPVVRDYTGKKSYTRITFLPDYDYFKFPKDGKNVMHEDLYNLIKRHAYDTAALIPVLVKFNEEKIKFKSEEEYLRLYYPNKKENPIFLFKTLAGDTVGLIQKSSSDFEESPQKKYESISFINGIKTKDGGEHVKKWVSELIKRIKTHFNARRGAKKLPDKTTVYRFTPYFIVYVRAETFEDINFKEQTKDTLTQPTNYPIHGDADKDEIIGFNKTLDKNTKKLVTWEFVKHLDMKLAGGKRSSLPKNDELMDDKKIHATLRGPYDPKKHKGVTRYGLVCEGDSAFNLFQSFQASIPGGRKCWGGMAVRGKIMNSDGVDLARLEKDESITRRLQVFYGLDYSLDYSVEANRKKLNYDMALSMTDSDDDGIHIRGLLMQYFGSFKGLLESGFYGSFNTFNVMLTPKTKKVKPLYFYSQKEYNDWRKKNPKVDLALYKARYLKGLGSHEQGEEVYYIPNEMRRIVTYKNDKNARENIKLGFSKTHKAERKIWVKNSIPTPDNPVEIGCIPTQGVVTISDFVKKELIDYEITTQSRAIPSLIDSFKKAQRQAFFTAITTIGYNKTVPLTELMSKAKTVAGYAHADDSIYGTIVNMARYYVGTNNIPLLTPNGLYGNRVTGKASAARYLKVGVQRICKSIFRDEDMPLLKRIVESGDLCEYEYFLPIICLILINGAKGVATGGVTDVPSYNPKDVVARTRDWLTTPKEERADLELEDLVPFCRDFKGKIYPDPKCEGRFINEGILVQDKKDETVWYIKEIPINMKVMKVAEILERYKKTNKELEKAKGKRAKTTKTTKKEKKTDEEAANYKRIEDYEPLDGTPENEVNIKVTTANGFVPDIDTKDNFNFLRTTIPTTQLNALDIYGVSRNYKRAIDLLVAFCEQRLPFYADRKKYWIAFYTRQKKIEENKKRFIEEVRDQVIDMKQTEEEVIEYLRENDYYELKELPKTEDGSEGEEEESEGEEGTTKGFNYLLSMQMRTMTENRLEKIQAEIDRIQKLIDYYKKMTPEKLWLKDLDDFEASYETFLKVDVNEMKKKEKILKELKEHFSPKNKKE